MNKKKKSTNISPYPDDVIDRLARAFYPAILACWNSEEGTIESKILGIEEILAEYPRVCCTKEGDRLLANGNPLVQALVDAQEKNGWIRMCSSEGGFAGVYQWDEKRNRYFPVKMF